MDITRLLTLRFLEDHKTSPARSVHRSKADRQFRGILNNENVSSSGTGSSYHTVRQPNGG
jgi:hypothetical protein